MLPRSPTTTAPPSGSTPPRANSASRPAPTCGELRFPPRPCCPHCQSFDSEWRRMSGRGRIWSYVAPASAAAARVRRAGPVQRGRRRAGRRPPHPAGRQSGRRAPDAAAELRRPGAAAHRRPGAGGRSPSRTARRAALGAGAAMTRPRRARTRTTGVAVVTLDRPERSTTRSTWRRPRELAAVWREFRFDDTVRAVVLTGAGRAGLLHRHRPSARGAAAPVPVHDRRSAARDRPEGERPVEAGDRRRGRAWPAAGRSICSGEAEFLVADADARPSSTRTPLRHGQRVRGRSTWRSGCRSGRSRGWR